MTWAPTYRNDTGLPSVTTILKPWMDTAHYTEEAATRGSWVHETIAAEITGAPAFLRPPAIPEWRGYVDSALDWYEHAVDEAIMVERRLTSQYGYCGQIDLVAKMHPSFGGGVALVDWKTGASPARWWDLQGAAYARLFEWAPFVDRILFVRPKPDGSGCLPAYEVPDQQSAWNLFYAALTLHQHFERGQ